MKEKKNPELDEKNINNVSEILKAFDNNKEELIPILQEIQNKFGYLPETAMEMTAEYLGVTNSFVFGVSTFYPFFKLVPTGKNVIKVCRGTACHVRGGARVLRETEKQLGIKPGESTDDLEYYLDTVACVGACAIAPTITINDKAFGQMTPEKITGIFNDNKGKK